MFLWEKKVTNYFIVVVNNDEGLRCQKKCHLSYFPREMESKTIEKDLESATNGQIPTKFVPAQRTCLRGNEVS